MHVLRILTANIVVLTASAAPFLASRQSGTFLSLPFAKQKQSHGVSLDRRAFSAPLSNQVVHYSIDLTIGTPPQAMTVVLDTGSSDIWFYAPGVCEDCTEPGYNPNSSTTERTLSDQGDFQISYSSTKGVVGYYASDILTLGDVSVPQIVGVATIAYQGTPSGGIMGIGLPQGQSLAERYGVAPYPGYLDTLKNYGMIGTRAYSIYLNDKSPGDQTTGTIIFGGDNPTARSGSLVAFEIVTPAPDGSYRLDVQEPTASIGLDGQTYQLPPAPPTYTVHLDTGTSLTFLPSDQMLALIEVLNTTGQVAFKPNDLGWLEVDLPCELSKASGGISFSFTGITESLIIEVPWSELLLTYEDNSEICLLGIASLSQADAQGVYGFGDTFLRSAYVLYNLDAGTISLAQASYDASPDQVVEL